ncbi:MAG: hypothetical protein RLZZ546_1937 [Bacteroidota bacterium]|jgi:hypothetical protein
MTEVELQKIIDQFDEDDLKSKGIFGILQYGGGPDESYIKANKEGLQLFALELLKSARDTENLLSDPNKNIIPFDSDNDWIDDNSGTFIQYIEPIAYKQESKIVSENGNSLASKIMPWIFSTILLFILLCLLIGLYTILNWVF